MGITREEVIAYGKDYYRDLITACCEIDEKHKEFVRMSLKALEQEPAELEEIDFVQKHKKIPATLDLTPCEDAISREQAIEQCGFGMTSLLIADCLRELPSVNPQPKYCDRNICVSNEYNGVGCDECEVTKSQEPKTDAIPVSKFNLGDNVVYGTDRNLYKITVSSSKEYEQEPCDVFDEYSNYKYPSDVELTEPNTATSMPCEDIISREDVVDILLNEMECVQRASDDECDRDCIKCNLLRDTDKILQAYRMAIKALEHPEKNVVAILP